MIERTRLQRSQRVIHIVEPAVVAIEAGNIEPRSRPAVAGVDGGAIFLFCADDVFVLLGDPSFYPMSHGGIQRRDLFRLSARFVLAAADDSGSFQIELRQISASFPTARIELDGAFELGVNLLCQAGGPEKAGVIRLLSVDSSQPEVVQTIVRSEFNCFLAGGNAGIPGAKLEVCTADEVIRLRCRSTLNLLLEDLHRFINTPGREKVLRG